MIQRTTNPNNTGYKFYGGRGIGVVKRWLKFENFSADMGERPSPEHQIHRLNPKKGYSKSNCCWSVDHSEAKVSQCNYRMEKAA
jgi:hypothetical protein